MTLDFTTQQMAKALANYQEDPWVWLWEITADVTEVATSVFHLTSYPEPVANFDRGDGEVWTYSPFPIQPGRIRETRSGDLLSLDVTVSNVTQELTSWILADGGLGFMNQPVVLAIANKDLLSEGAAILINLTTNSISVSNTSATFVLEAPNYFRATTPTDVFTRDTCRHQFKGPRCAYPGTLTTCNRTRARCIEIGDDEVANGYPRLHPERFGAFPGMIRRG